MLCRPFAVATIAVATIAVFAAASFAEERLFDFQQTTLDNGLTVVTLEDFSTPIVAVQVWYEVGSKDEHISRQGFAHMFEHMMFRGTELLGPEEHFALIRGVGGTANAFTSFDYTAYVNKVPSNQLELALWLEAERMMFLDVSQENYDVERRVVEEERMMGLNRPYGAVFEQLLPVVFEQHPYQWTPIGKIAHLREAELDELQHFWDEYYVPSNATLVIVGAVPHAEALAKAEHYFGWMPTFPTPERVTIEEPAQEAERAIEIREALGQVPLARYVYRGVSAQHEDATALELAVNILGDGESSRLYQELVQEQQICQGAYAWNWNLAQDGLFMIGAELAQGGDGDTEPVYAAMDAEIARIREEGVRQEELDKVKNQALRSLITSQLEIESKARTIGQYAIEYGDPEGLNQVIEDYRAVTVEDIQRVITEYFVPERRTVATVIPDPEFQYDSDATVRHAAYEPPSGALQKVDIERPDFFPTVPPLADLLEEAPEIPMIEHTLPNGLKVVVVENDEVPFVTLTLGLRHGAWVESAETPGLASMTLDMLTAGTENYTSSELAEKLEFNALTLGGSAGEDVATVNGSALADKFPMAMELLAEVVLRPTFPERELGIKREQRKNSLSVQESNAQYLADRALEAALYGEHPYARPVGGVLATVDDLDREGLIAWWETFARPDAAVLYIAGDVDPEEAFAEVERVLGEWQAEGAMPEIELPEFPVIEGRRIILVDRPGTVQTQIRVGHLGFNRLDPDWHAAFVFSDIFGRGFNSRINRVIRIERGLTYGAWGGFNGQRFTGNFIGSTFTRPETTAEAVQAILDVMEGMRSAPVTDHELEQSRAALVGRFPSNLETPQDAASYAWLIEYNGLPADYLQQALDGYKNTTHEDLQRIAEERMSLDDLVIVVVGDAAAVRESLEEIASVTVVESGELAVAALE